MIYDLFPKFQMRHGGFHFMASDSQMKVLTLIEYMIFAALSHGRVTNLSYPSSGFQ